MSKILVTGAFGNIGSRTIQALLQKGHMINTFDIKNLANQQKALELGDQVQCFWGDLRDSISLESAIQGCDVVIHLAAIIPPMSERKPELTREVNIKGTKNLLEMMQKTTPKPRLIFTSSITVFGDTHALDPPRRVTDPIRPTDTYSSTKVECEDLIHKSGIETIVLRLAATPAVNMNNVDPIMFDIRLDTRMEYVHPTDVARAISNAISCEEAWGQTFLIGGGKECQLMYRDFINGIFEVLGIGSMPDYAFGKNPFYTDWLDTEASQRLLQFQEINYQDWTEEIVNILGAKVFLIKIMRPIVRLWLLSKSPYWRNTAIENIRIWRVLARLNIIHWKEASIALSNHKTKKETVRARRSRKQRKNAEKLVVLNN